MAFWSSSQVNTHITPISGHMYRTVKNQTQGATMALVGDLDEQDELEKMLNILDPGRLHYLLAAPFRNPPLPHGSRFGTNQQRGIFYASCTLQTSLAEDAYYSLVFRYESVPLRQRKTKNDMLIILEADYATDDGLRLQDLPFNQERDILRSPNSYSDTQLLGQLLRAKAVRGFEYESARGVETGINVALFSPLAIQTALPTAQYEVLIQIHEEGVKYRIAEKELIFHFPLTQFLFNGELPLPA